MSRGYRVRVKFPIIQEYRYLKAEGSQITTATYLDATIFRTQARAQSYIGVFKSRMPAGLARDTQFLIEAKPSFDPDWVSATGASVLDCLEQLGISETDFAERMGETSQWAEGFLEGIEPLTKEQAERLVSIVGGGVEFWLNREAHYREGLRKGLQTSPNDRPRKVDSG